MKCFLKQHSISCLLKQKILNVIINIFVGPSLSYNSGLLKSRGELGKGVIVPAIYSKILQHDTYT